MIFLELFLGFLQVGCFAFGGAYGAIPLIRDVVLSYGWLNDETLTYMIAVSESTPGPIMVNMATYIGSSQAGLLGAAVATLAVVLPSFLVILIVLGILQNAMQNKYVQALLRGVKPCVVGIVLATGLELVLRNCLAESRLDLTAVLITLLLVGAMFGYKKWTKKKLSPIMLILLSAVLGAIVYGI
jgi:chromate transporter